MTCPPQQAYAEEEILIGLRANRGVEKDLKRWQLTADYLSTRIPGFTFKLVPFESNNALNQAVSRNEFHFVLTNPASAVEHTLRYKTRPLATLLNKRQEMGYSKFGSVIFTRSDRDDIQTFKDLLNKEFIAVDEHGFGGWRVAWRELLQNDIDPYSDFKKLLFAGGLQPNVVYSVINGEADAGSVRTDMLERMVVKGEIDLSDIKVIGSKNTADFPFLHSTQLYPEWLFSKTTMANESLTDKVASVILNIEASHPAAIRGKYVGWVLPRDYQPVHDLLKELRVGPYHKSSYSIIDELWNQYQNVFIIFMFSFIGLSLLLVYAIKTNRKLNITQVQLTREIANREDVEVILRDLAQESIVSGNVNLFYQNCLINLCKLFNCKYALIGLLEGDQNQVVRAFLEYDGEKFTAGRECSIKDSPCQDILREDLLNVSKDLKKQYPQDKNLLEFDIESCFGAPLLSPDGEKIGLVSVMDVKPMYINESAHPLMKIFANRIAAELYRKRQEDNLQNLAQRMSYHATHDALTGLINRRELENRIHSAYLQAKTNKEEHVFCYLDLDQFKVVNDTCGHFAGDELLRQLVFKLKKEVRESDTLARLGGDEFGVLLLDCPLSRGEAIAKKLLDVVNQFRFVWHEKVFDIGVSIGMVAINHNTRSAHEVLINSDSACYVAKERGRNRIHIYQSDDAVSKRQDEIQWVNELNWAIKNSRFEIHSQAIRLLGEQGAVRDYFEILIRLRNRQNELLMPGAFIGAAERYNIMPEIDRQVIDHSFAYLENKLKNTDKQETLCFINISALSLTDQKFEQSVLQGLQKYKISPENICFELTETAAITNFTHAVSLINKMKKSGFRFALDDFGTGLCSYEYLRSLPIDFLKIDGRFVSNFDEDPMNKAIVESIAHIGRVIGIPTIAEWVENTKTLQYIESLGIDYAQGYAIGKPQAVNH